MPTHHSTELCLSQAVPSTSQFDHAESNAYSPQSPILPHFEPGFLQPLIISRDSHRNFLYGEEHDHPDIIESLASLTLRIPQGSLAKVQGVVGKFKRYEITEAVDAILAKHNDLSQEGDTVGCFSLTDVERDLPALSSITAAIIWRWERVCHYHEKPSPFRALPVFDINRDDFYRADVQLVIEAASVALEALQNGYRVNRKNPSSPNNVETASFLARRGPKFANAWARGEAIISDYCTEHGLEADEWLKALNPAYMRTIAVANIEPREMLGTKIKQFRMEMTSESLANQLGWPIKKVDDVFPPWLRHNIWVTHTHPQKTIIRIVEQLETTYNTAVIAEAIGWDTQQVDEVFSVADRVRIFKSCRDPIGKFRDKARDFDTLTPEYIAGLISWPLKDVKAVFLPSLIKRRMGHSNNDTFIKAMAKRYKTLSDEALARKFNLTIPQVNSLFPPNRKIRLAELSSATLSRRLPNILKLNIELSQKYEFPPAITSALAHQSRVNAYKTAQAIIADLESKPDNISDVLWMWQRVNWPSATRQMLVKSAQGWLKLLEIFRPISSDASHRAGSFASEASAEDIFMSVQPDDYLQSLASKAKVSSAQLQKLLEHFKNSGTESLDALQPVLDRLKSSVG